MKTKLTIIIAILIGFISIAQNGINYKAVIKDSNGDILSNTLIAVRFTIHEGAPGGTAVYQEDHSPNTDANGLIMINIGEGNPLLNLFSDIDWAGNTHFLNVQINTGSGLTNMGTTQFKTVPYALSAPSTSKWESNANGIYRLNDNIGIGATPSSNRKLYVINNDEPFTAYIANAYDGTSSKYGIYNYTDAGGTGSKYGLYNNIAANNATATTYGLYNTISTTGATGNMYGMYSFISSTGGGSNYALYGYAAGAGNYGIYAYNNSLDQGWAAYLNGRTQITDRLMVGTDHRGRVGVNLNQKELYVRNADTTVIRGRYAGAGTGGEIELYMNAGNRTLELQASETANTGSQIQMYKAHGSLGISLDADFLGLGRVTTQEIEVTGEDLAEFFTVNSSNLVSDIRPGVLLSIDEENPGDVVMTSEAYDKKIAGIISGANGVRPGLLMGGEMGRADETLPAATGEFPIALAGKAYVYANAENGPIKVGDMLTSSSTPGYAMKVNDYERARGAIIGKAMTALEGGDGFVLVLISLN